MSKTEQTEEKSILEELFGSISSLIESDDPYDRLILDFYQMSMERTTRVKNAIQEKEARWWRDASLLYFQTFSGMPIPDHVEKPTRSLEYFKSLTFPSVPGH